MIAPTVHAASCGDLSSTFGAPVRHFRERRLSASAFSRCGVEDIPKNVLDLFQSSQDFMTEEILRVPPERSPLSGRDSADIKHDAASASASVLDNQSALSLLAFVSSLSGSLASFMPPTLLDACYASAVIKVIHACNEIVATSGRCRQAARQWGRSPSLMRLPSRNAAEREEERQRVEEERHQRALNKATVKLLMTVALPTLVMHGIEHSGWDMVTHASTVADALSASSLQLSQVLHLALPDMEDVVAKLVQCVAGIHLQTFLNSTVEDRVEGVMQQHVRPAMELFLTRTLSCSLSMSRVASHRGPELVDVKQLLNSAGTTGLLQSMMGGSIVFGAMILSMT